MKRKIRREKKNISSFFFSFNKNEYLLHIEVIQLYKLVIFFKNFDATEYRGKAIYN